MYVASKVSARPAKRTITLLINIKTRSISFKQVDNTVTSTIFPSVMISMGFVPSAILWIIMRGKQLSKILRRVQQSHGIPWIPQDIPLKKKTRELPQVNILDTIEEFVSSTLQSQSTMRYTMAATTMVVLQIKITQEQPKDRRL